MPTTLAELTTEVVNLLTTSGIFSLVALVGAFGAVISGGAILARRMSKAFR